MKDINKICKTFKVLHSEIERSEKFELPLDIIIAQLKPLSESVICEY